MNLKKLSLKTKELKIRIKNKRIKNKKLIDIGIVFMYNNICVI